MAESGDTATKKSRYFMIRLHIQVFFDKVKAPFNNAVIHTCRAADVAVNTSGSDAGTVRTYLGTKCVLGNCTSRDGCFIYVFLLFSDL